MLAEPMTSQIIEQHKQSCMRRSAVPAEHARTRPVVSGEGGRRLRSLADAYNAVQTVGNMLAAVHDAPTRMEVFDLLKRIRTTVVNVG